MLNVNLNLILINIYLLKIITVYYIIAQAHEKKPLLYELLFVLVFGCLIAPPPIDMFFGYEGKLLSSYYVSMFISTLDNLFKSFAYFCSPSFSDPLIEIEAL
jgi:hypothetical protein